MSSSSSKLKPTPHHQKQLKELLQEKQEPFKLDIYLPQSHPKKKSAKRTRNLENSNILKLVTNKLIFSYRSTFSKISTSGCKHQTKQRVLVREVKARGTKCQCECMENVKQLIPISAEASKANKNKKYVIVAIEEESKKVAREKNQQKNPKSYRGTVGHNENSKNIAQLIKFDLFDEMRQWNNFKLLISEIKIEIGDAILDDIILELVVY